MSNGVGFYAKFNLNAVKLRLWCECSCVYIWDLLPSGVQVVINLVGTFLR